ncbi:major facilitator superfamily domain-containing protein [Aspergillus navahoensis]
MQASAETDSQLSDGGYVWVAVSGCAVLTWWFTGTSYSWGILQAALVNDGFGTRVCGVLGIVFLGVGEILSGFALRSIGGLFLTAGAVMGVASVTPAQYFRAKRGIANGIVYAAGGLGGAVISFIVDALVQGTGLAWTFRTLGLITLATGVPAALFIKERAPIPKSAFVEWNLFRDIRFTLLFLVGAIATFPLFVPPFFLPLYTSSLGMKSSVGAGVVAAFNFSSALGRLMCGFFSDKLGPLNTLFLSLLLSAVSMLVLWPVSSSIAPLVSFVIINGMANGGFFSTMPTVVGNVFGSARGAPIAGYILDASGGEQDGIKAYRPAIFYAGSLAFAAAVLAAAIRLKADMNLKKRV